MQKTGYHILRRRIAVVLGQWLPVKEGLDRRLVYQIFQHLLDPSFNDRVIRVTAGRHLKNVVDPFEFSAEQFKPFANTLITRLMALIQEVEITETKMALLNTLSVIVVRMEVLVRSFDIELRIVCSNTYRSSTLQISSCRRYHRSGMQQVKNICSSNQSLLSLLH